ncbi:DNA cytosine methyltransferase [Photobacterium damselae subsp. piscicida]|uniref:DNA cytosine methyltransferase n=1 Tax=Photobacterium damselae TaxID=38293 RepID=UPI0002E917D4|nr:DNA (cytosine-5-)-methyltransferase [Photobacterium damselae]OLQ80034.1 DNA (cytosine-5-)-methyltransferase [Photobacterium damselae subsp. piscicida]TFZ62173.1 DNA cytosine methyltransferase [Photobacterium damselae subsp. piscicida]TJZ89833.1 DNA cytosine methyltransferase [Photobacterium damselae subsp. piscicida]
MMTGEILVIDLFAGPGGLGEGISSVADESGNYPFKIGISVEKEPSAHKTLTTRAFYRRIKALDGGLDSYFRYVSGELTREELFCLYPEHAQEASKETLEQPRALGDDNELIHDRIRELLATHIGPKVVIGGPPCQAYSLAGRSRNAGNKDYKAEDDHRNFLYKEYLKVLSIAQPDVFVMENVRGILSAKINGKVMFPQILEDLRNPSKVTGSHGVAKYRVFSLVVEAKDPKDPKYDKSSDFLIRSEQYGVPQARHRVILLGIRQYINRIPVTIAPIAETVTVQQVLSDLPPLRSGFSKQKDVQKDWEKQIRLNAKKLKRILTTKFDKEVVDNLDLEPMLGLERQSCLFMEKEHNIPPHLESWYLYNHPSCVLNHATRGHTISDLLRYGFSAAFTKLSGGISPKARDFPTELAPEHENWDSGSHADRFRTQAANKCATTVTSHISKDGHYFIHYDPQQCRSLTVREAARLQTFPDNYFFEGNRTQQYVQVGNAVPPYLANQIGKIVLGILDVDQV